MRAQTCSLPPREWRALFSPEPNPQPSVSSDRRQEAQRHSRPSTPDLCARQQEADASLLAAVKKYEPARNPFYTAGEFVAGVSADVSPPMGSSQRGAPPPGSRVPRDRVARSLNSDRTSLLGAITCWVQWCGPAGHGNLAASSPLWVPE